MSLARLTSIFTGTNVRNLNVYPKSVQREFDLSRSSVSELLYVPRAANGSRFKSDCVVKFTSPECDTSVYEPSTGPCAANSSVTTTAAADIFIAGNNYSAQIITVFARVRGRLDVALKSNRMSETGSDFSPRTFDGFHANRRRIFLLFVFLLITYSPITFVCCTFARRFRWKEKTVGARVICTVYAL